MKYVVKCLECGTVFSPDDYVIKCPNVFFDISATLDKKIEAPSCYKSEIKEFSHPRSLEAVELNAKMRGVKVGLKYAEGFYLVHEIQ